MSVLPAQSRLVVSFNSTTEAFSFNQAAQSAGLGGRLIPVPRQLSASCGFAFLLEQGSQTALDEFLAQGSVSYAAVQECLL